MGGIKNEVFYDSKIKVLQQAKKYLKKEKKL